MNALVPANPEHDTDAQDKIWNDTKRGARELLERWNVRLYLGVEEQSDVLSQDHVPFFGAGKLVELLSVVGFLRSADSMPAQKVFNLRGTTAPIPFTKDGAKRFLWVQPTRLKGMSGWGARPDLLVTTSPECVIGSNDFVIECKHVAHLRSSAIRGEFGKGHDLGVKKYHVWSFYKPELEMVAGAAAIGIELSGVGFDTPAQTHDIPPGQLLDLFTAILDQSDRNEAFADSLRQAALRAAVGRDDAAKLQ